MRATRGKKKVNYSKGIDSDFFFLINIVIKEFSET